MAPVPRTARDSIDGQPPAGTRVRLLRAVEAPTGDGPGNGQYALQKALRARGADGLAVGGRLQEGEVPWFWCWLDRGRAAETALAGRPLVIGPNVLFASSRRPRSLPAERVLCNTASCRLVFTESAWYRELIERHLGPASRARIVVWPYPIDPRPGGPLPAVHDLLIYAKSGYRPELIERLRRCYRRSILLTYGRHRRSELFEAARSCRACVYLSDDDRGPLALAEILLSGCPAVGLPTGAPFVQHGRTGILLDRLDADRCIDAVEDCLEMDRCRVAALAAEQFDTERIVDTVLGALRLALEPATASA